MNGTHAQDPDNLRKHLAALRASAQLFDRQPDEALGTARRIAHALARLGTEPHHADVAAAAHQLIDAPAGHAQAALDGLITQLEHGVENLLSPRGVVLLVEDDRWLAELFSHVLTSKGWEVAIAGTAEQAEAIVDTRKVSAIVLDLVLPDADGRNLLLRLKEDPRSASVPVVVASAHDDPHVQAECLALGASDFLKKPVDPKALVELITRRAVVSPGGVAFDATDLQSEILGALDDIFEPATAAMEAAIEEPPSPIADATMLAEAFSAMPNKARTLALLAPVWPTTGGSPPAGATIVEALERIGAALADALGDDELVARGGVGELVVLLQDSSTGAACRRLERVQEALSQTVGGELEFAAGVVLTGETELEDAIDQAGHLLYLALESPDNRVLCDAESVPPPTVRILLAEDDAMTAKLLVYRLKREPGFEVSHCEDGLQALATIEAGHIDLAILDINMPGMDGFDLLARIRDTPRFADLPIAMLTALGSENEIVRGLELGANDYITKPFSPTEVIARVRRLLGRSRRVA
jgi:DNA-binding response OmpR family regulator